MQERTCQNPMLTTDFEFELPEQLIAQQPVATRDLSRLMVLERNSRQTEHRRFSDIHKFLNEGDVLVLNNSRVIPARLRGENLKTGGQFEALLLTENSKNDWWAMLRPGKRARPGTRINFKSFSDKQTDLEAIVVETNLEGHRRLQFLSEQNLLNLLNQYGEVPLPPYIARP